MPLAGDTSGGPKRGSNTGRSNGAETGRSSSGLPQVLAKGRATSPVGPLSDELDLLRLAAELVLGESFRPDAAFTKAVDLVAKGVEGEATVALAMQPADPRRLDSIEVRALFQAMLDERGLELVAPGDAGWVKARWIAERMLDGAIEPAAGADRLWQLWRECGAEGDELTWMLQLHDAWSRQSEMLGWRSSGRCWPSHLPSSRAPTGASVTADRARPPAAGSARRVTKRARRADPGRSRPHPRTERRPSLPGGGLARPPPDAGCGHHAGRGTVRVRPP